MTADADTGAGGQAATYMAVQLAQGLQVIAREDSPAPDTTPYHADLFGP